MKIKALIPAILKKKVAHSNISLYCHYAGCGATDSWPLFVQRLV